MSILTHYACGGYKWQILLGAAPSKTTLLLPQNTKKNICLIWKINIFGVFFFLVGKLNENRC